MIEFWHWWVVAAVLGALDMLAQSGFFLWLGGAALVVGFVLFGWPDLSWQFQFFLFAVMAILAVIATRFITRREPPPSDRPLLNRRGLQYVGQLIVLETAIVNGRGRAFVGDTLWTVEGPDAPNGETVRVIGTDGTLLQVEKP
ncbi:MAG: NfeD family protein [Azospirillum sp.]|nr:NfeD family protein [Azospirillum sp.]